MTGATRCDADAEGAASLASADLVIARVYDGTSYSGSSLTFVKSSSRTAGYDNEVQWDDLRSTSGGNWNDRITSVRAYERCDVKLVQNIRFGGSSLHLDRRRREPRYDRRRLEQLGQFDQGSRNGGRGGTSAGSAPPVAASWPRARPPHGTALR
ncbi:hypothetical protein [Pilimelia columellifera]|uniref:Uncharacterized protein n=1 Tax=Pilimelia columellifera subsp. columellifera TaxID=706583 RepID=A0ABN3NDX1_9ACTN